MDLVTESLTLMAGELQLAALGHLVEPVHPGGGLLGDALDGRQLPGVEAGIRRQLAPDGAVEGGLLLVAGVVQQAGVPLGPGAQVHQQGGVAAVVQDHVGGAPGEGEDLVGEGPVVVQGFALVGEHRRPALGDGGGGVVLGGEDVAGGPAHVGAQGLQGLDQHRGLDGHVQRAGDPGPAQRLGGRVLLADRHEAGHLGLGDGHLPAAPGREGPVGDAAVVLGGVHGLAPSMLAGVAAGFPGGLARPPNPAGFVGQAPFKQEPAGTGCRAWGGCLAALLGRFHDISKGADRHSRPGRRP